MFWIIAVLAVLVNEYLNRSNENGWVRSAVKNFAALTIIIALAYKNPAETLVTAIVALSAFVGWELYLMDIRRRDKSSQVTHLNFNG